MGCHHLWRNNEQQKKIEGSFLSEFLSNLWLFCRLIKEGLTYHRKQPRVTFFFFFFFIFSGFLWLHSSLCPQIWPAHRIPFYTHHLNSIICMCSVTKSKEVHCKHAMPKNKWKFKQKTITNKALRKGSMFSYRMTVRVSLASDRTPCFP